MNNESKTHKAAEIKYQLVCAFEESKPMLSYPQKIQKSISIGLLSPLSSSAGVRV